jgi:hypothetical protein
MLGVVQFILAIVIILLLLMLGFFAYNRDILTNLQTMRNRKITTELIRGGVDLNGPEINVETTDQNSAMYKPMPSSINQRSGGEFTYNFWLWVDRSAITSSSDLGDTIVKLDTGINTTTEKTETILFYRGMKNKYEYKNLCGESKSDILVKAPLVKLQQGGSYLTVEFNTVQGPDAHIYNGRNTCREASASWSAINRPRITLGGFDSNPNFDKQWFMVSVVIQDTLPEDPIPTRNKVRVRMYVNGILELDQYIEGGPMGSSQPAVLLNNNGNLYINPKEFRASTIGDGKLMMANLTYSNYAMSGSEIKELFDKKFTLTSPNGTVNFNLPAQQNFSAPSVSGKPQLKLIL